MCVIEITIVFKCFRLLYCLVQLSIICTLVVCVYNSLHLFYTLIYKWLMLKGRNGF